MSKAGGLFLIAAGIGVAIYAMPSHEADTSLVAEPVVQESTVAKREVPAVPKVESAPANNPAKVEIAGALQPQRAEGGPIIQVPVPKPAVRPVRAPDPKAAGDGSRATVVTVPQRATEATEPRVSAANLPGDRYTLTRELQRELRRVGCYDGNIDGAWTPASRRAMKSFTDRANASLPVDQPDYILLRLVQGTRGQVCGTSCPSGQELGRDGRCVPAALVAQTGRKPAQPARVAKESESERSAGATSAWVATATTTNDLPQAPEGRMSLSGPKSAEPARAEAPRAPLTESEVREPASGTERRADSRRAKPPASATRDRRYVEAPRRQKFGTWYFRQQERWGN